MILKTIKWNTRMNKDKYLIRSFRVLELIKIVSKKQFDIRAEMQ